MRGVARVEPLDLEDCLACLATTATGRIAASQAALPIVFPIRFAILSGGVVFSLPPGSPRWSAIDDHVVAFEADSEADSSDGCWSVQIQGVCREVPSMNIDPLGDLPLPRWHHSGAADHLMFLPLERVSGERITWGLAEPYDPIDSDQQF